MLPGFVQALEQLAESPLNGDQAYAVGPGSLEAAYRAALQLQCGLRRSTPLVHCPTGSLGTVRTYGQYTAQAVHSVIPEIFGTSSSNLKHGAAAQQTNDANAFDGRH